MAGRTHKYYRVKRDVNNGLIESCCHKQKCTFLVPFCIPRCLVMQLSPSNFLEKRSLSLGLKNIMVYVISFLVMTGKKRKQVKSKK